jgi:hypothetical protein
MRPYRSRARIWALALGATLGLHVIVVLGVRALSVLDPGEITPAPPDVVELTFVPQPAPKAFTELPEDRADEPPERPEALSNVDSRARDRIEGGADDSPQLQGRSDAPQIQMNKGGAPAAPPAPEPLEPVEETPAPAEAEDAGDPSRVVPATESLLAAILRDRVRAQPSPSEPTPPGDSDIYQEETNRPSRNAGLSGGITLSTTAWEHAPWVMDFQRRVESRWTPPVAYFMGLVHGWTLIEVEVEPSGVIRRLDVIDGTATGDTSVTHKALETAAIFALEGSAPYKPLPDHFPDETLVLQIRFNYWKLRR